MPSVWTPNFDCAEEFGTRQENWNTENPIATVVLRCKMDERYLIMADIVGNYREYPFVTPVTLKATNSSIILDKACKLPEVTESAYETGYDALITITYTFVKGRLYTQTEDPQNWPSALYAEEDMEPSMQFLTDDYNKYGWGKDLITDPLVIQKDDEISSPGGAMKAGEEPGKAFYQLAVTRVVKGYEDLPYGYEPTYDPATGNIINYTPLQFHIWPGRVHSVDYYSEFLKMYFPAGTLLFTQPKVTHGAGIIAYTSTEPTVPKGPTWSITAKLLYQEQGWNSFYRPTVDCQSMLVIKEPYYAMVHKACGGTGDPKEYPRHLPYSYLNMSEFLFNWTTFPTDPWPPEID